MVFHGKISASSARVHGFRTAICIPLNDASIPYVLWGSDVLRYTFRAPMALSDFYIVVADTHLSDAASALITAIPDLRPAERQVGLLSSPYGNFPECIQLEDTWKVNPNRRNIMNQPFPYIGYPIVLVPASLVCFDLSNPKNLKKSICTSYRSPYSWPLMQPTLPAILEACLKTIDSIPKMSWTEHLWKLWDPVAYEEFSKRCSELSGHANVMFCYLQTYAFKRAEVGPRASWEKLPERVKKVVGQMSDEGKKLYLDWMIQEEVYDKDTRPDKEWVEPDWEEETDVESDEESWEVQVGVE